MKPSTKKKITALLLGVSLMAGCSSAATAAMSFSAARVAPVARVVSAPRVSIPKPSTPVVTSRPTAQATTAAPKSQNSTFASLMGLFGGLMLVEAVDEGVEAVVDNLMGEEETE